MGRKNVNATRGRRSGKYNIPKGMHFIYSTDEFGEDASVVRYLGEQRGDLLLCYMPWGAALWCHVSHLSRSARATAQANAA